MAKTKGAGTELFFSFDNTTLVKFVCPVAINNIGFTTTMQDSSCLDSLTRTEEPIEKVLNAVTVPFLYEADESHKEVLEMLDTNNPIAGEVLWGVFNSDGTADPTVTTGTLTPPTGRTGFHGKGHITAVNVSYTRDNWFGGELTLQPTTQHVAFKA